MSRGRLMEQSHRHDGYHSDCSNSCKGKTAFLSAFLIVTSWQPLIAEAEESGEKQPGSLLALCLLSFHVQARPSTIVF